MGDVKFAGNQSFINPRWSGKLDPQGQFTIEWQSKGQIAPDPYDPVAFPGISANWIESAADPAAPGGAAGFFWRRIWVS